MISEGIGASLLRFMHSPNGEYRHLIEELNNLTTPAKEELRKLLISIRIRSEEWGHKNAPPELRDLLLQDGIADAQYNQVQRNKKLHLRLYHWVRK